MKDKSIPIMMLLGELSVTVHLVLVIEFNLLVFPSSRELNAFHGLSLLGKVIRLEMSKPFVVSQAPHSEGSNKKVAEIEQALYCRDAETVYQRLLAYSDEAETERFRELQYLTNQTLPSMPVVRDSWDYGELDTEDQSFQTDLEKYSRICPPGFDVTLFSSKDGSIREAVELIRFKVKILELVHNREAHKLTPFLDRIIAVCEQSPSFLKNKTLLDILDVLSTRRSDMLAFGREVVQRVIRTWNETAAQILHRLLYPTIFDQDAGRLVNALSDRHAIKSLPAPKDVESRDPSVAAPFQPMVEGRNGSQETSTNSPRNSVLFRVARLDVALAMIDLELQSEAKDPTGEQINAIIQVLWENPAGTISARTMWQFITKLLEQSQMDRYLHVLGKIIPQGGSFADALLDHLHEEVFPKIKYILAQSIDTQRPTLVLRAITLIVLMGVGLGLRLSKDVEALLIDRFRCLVKSMMSEDYSSLKGFDALVNLLNGLACSKEAVGLGREFARLKLILAPTIVNDEDHTYADPSVLGLQ